jgi:heptosyltransferase-2
MSISSGRILVLRGGAIGDFILTLPVFSALRAQFSQAHLCVLGYRQVAELARAGGLVDDARSIEAQALAGFFADRGVLDSTLQKFFAGFDVILSYLYDPDGVFQSNVARCSLAQFIAGPHRPDERAGLHATDMLLKPLQRLAIFDADPCPRLVLPGPANIDGASAGEGPLAFHPGSGSELKNWPEPRWAELLKTLGAAKKNNLLLVGGEAEGERLERLSRCLPRGQVILASNRPLTELALQLRACAGFVGHDSGISHLAAALGLPVLCLWGETNESVWRPRGEQVRLLRAPGGLTGLTVRQVLEEIAGLWP